MAPVLGAIVSLRENEDGYTERLAKSRIIVLRVALVARYQGRSV
jgi:hypothetical protein